MRNAVDIFLRTPARIYCFADTVELCRTLLDAGARVIQLRHKTADDAAFGRAVEMLDCVRSYEDAVLIVNDRVDIALDIGADGIHVGQEDRDCREVVRRAPASMIVGVSARYPDVARSAAAAGATYVGAGAVFATPTKPEAVVIGLKGLQAVVAAVDIPVVAIGGITRASPPAGAGNRRALLRRPIGHQRYPGSRCGTAPLFSRVSLFPNRPAAVARRTLRP